MLTAPQTDAIPFRRYRSPPDRILNRLRNLFPYQLKISTLFFWSAMMEMEKYKWLSCLTANQERCSNQSFIDDVRSLKEIESMDELVVDLNNEQVSKAFDLCKECDNYQPGYIQLGVYNTSEGLSYDCRFFPEECIADAIGPLPAQGQTGARGTTFTVTSKNITESRQFLEEEIGPGHW